MPEPDPAYVNGLVTQLRTRRPDLLDAAEDELKRLRHLLAHTVAFIHDPAYDDAARRALAQALGLPEPAARKGGPAQ